MRSTLSMSGQYISNLVDGTVQLLLTVFVSVCFLEFTQDGYDRELHTNV